MPPSRRPPRGTWPDRACMGSDPQGQTPTDGCSLQRDTNRRGADFPRLRQAVLMASDPLFASYSVPSLSIAHVT